MSVYKDLRSKISKKTSQITVMGLGYVGLPIALSFCEQGFSVTGFDPNKKRVDKLRKGVSYINDIPSERIVAAKKKYQLTVTTKEEVIGRSDIVIICVPTPLRKIKEPNMTYIVKASKSVGKHLKHGQMVILESTTYPGTTREIVLPMLEKSGLKLDDDFYLAFSPERIDPGNPKYDFKNIPKVIGGFTEHGTQVGKYLYSKVIKKVIGVSSPEAAEVSKLLENTFRIVNIGLVNEFAHLCHRLDIDVWEVIKAAETKPFGFMPFYPGPGIGGHCIPADPMYLSWKARKVGFETRMVDLAAWVNRHTPVHIVERIRDILAEKNKRMRGANICISGVTYKKDVNDLRESPALDIIKGLNSKKAVVAYHDPLIPYLDIGGVKARSSKLSPKFLKSQDLVVIVTDHTDMDYQQIADNSRVIFDTRNVFETKNIKSDKIIRL